MGGQTGAHARDHLLVTASVQIAHTGYYTILMSRRADQPADNRADRSGPERYPPSIATVMVSVMNDMMPRRRWRRAMRTMPSVMRRGNRRTSRQRQTREKNRNRLGRVGQTFSAKETVRPLSSACLLILTTNNLSKRTKLLAFLLVRRRIAI